MNSDELEQVLRDEAETHRDGPLPEGAGTRPNLAHSTVYSVRLRAEEVAAVQAAADEAGLPASTLVRSWILQRLSGSSPAEATLRALIREEVQAAVHTAVREAVQEASAS
jgi:hypothetical protein